MSEEAVPQTTSAEGTTAPAAAGQTSRLSRWSSSWAACKHIAASFAKDLRVRTADKVTLGLLLASAAMAVGVVAFPDMSVQIGAACDLFFALTILFYIAQRFGVMTTFDSRQTVFATELMFGFLIAGIFIVINLTIWFLHQ